MMNSKIPKGRTMIKWRAFAALPEQFIGINKLIEEQTKIKRPTLTPEEQEIIEKKIIDSYTSESEILLTYFEDGRLLTCYMTVVNMNSLKQSITCTDPYRNKITINFKDIIHIQ
ncbi:MULTISPECIES: YolD-like family protein [Bacillus]|uniref:YolD-like family protein n=1 Tax=Bacillus TaxID=1386 RepID=UPI001155CD91|nr:YolD-like family protein [Bacillus thuringiensis]MCU7392789.1 YolD-like family protein [Bacillus sp. ST24]